jgi:hypothetical protein
VTYRTNTGPTDGKFTITPETGNEFDTRFTFKASNWEDPDQPLQYQFLYTLNGVTKVLRALQPAETFEAQMAAGEFTITLDVCDKHNSCTKRTFGNTIVVNPMLPEQKANVQVSQAFTDSLTQVEETPSLINNMAQTYSLG